MNSVEAWKIASEGLSGADSWWAKISDAYSSQNRHYHNLAFLDRKFILLEELGTACDLKALTLAIFFQYFDYDPQDRARYKNLEHFKKFAAENELPEEVARKVEGFLSGDEAESPDADDDKDFQLLQDLDVSFLGLDSDTYADLIQSERKEYNFLTDEAYQSMRRKILQTFNLIPNIFSTAECQSRFEAQARINISAEIKVLGN